MSVHYLRFTSLTEAVATIQLNEPELLWDDNGTPRIKGNHDFAVALIGELTHQTGITLEDGSLESVPVAGYHINVNAVGRSFPDYLLPFEVFPVTPSVSFGE